MSVTNAISGLTAAGGLLCLGGGYLPGSFSQFLAASAVLVSSVNIAGGFVISKRMLDMFKRKTDAPEHNYLYGMAGATLLGSIFYTHMVGIPHIYTMGYLASSVLCIGAICGLAAQSTARVGAVLGNIGVAGGVLTTMLAMNFSFPVMMQALALLSVGGGAGLALGLKVAVTELP